MDNAFHPVLGHDDRAMDIATAIRRHGGVATYRELLVSLDRPTIEQALASGAVTRLRRGVYGLPTTDAALSRSKEVGGVLSHLSAALWHGWKVARLPKEPAVTIARHRSGIDATGLQVHWGNLIGETDVTSPLRTVIDCARTLPYDEALAVADSALRSRKITAEQLQDAAERSPRTGRRKAQRVASTATHQAANPFESVLRAIAADVPGLSVVAQGEIDEWTHPDLVDFELRVALEADSFTYHSLEEAFAYDVRRYTGLVRSGWLVARFTWEEVMHKQSYVREVLRDLVALRTQQRAVRCPQVGGHACSAR